MSNSQRILAQGEYRNNDTWVTGINNNDLIIGPSGAGKTRGYVMPNILQCNESMVIADTKGSLYGQLAPLLRKRGYRVMNIDFANLLASDGYNPLDYIRFDKSRGKYLEQDIQTLAAAVIPVTDTKEPFWDESARMLLSALVGYVLEVLPQEEHTMDYVVRLFNATDGNNPPKSLLHDLFQGLAKTHPDSFAVCQYLLYSRLQGADKTDACVQAFLARALSPLSFEGPVHMYRCPNRIDFKSLGRKKTAVFLTVSDTDRSMDNLASLFYTQALNTLCQSADKDYQDHRLPVPVRFILDDFATNVRIPNFDKIISVIRSREIYVSVILQSISQLESVYSHGDSMTIINNCDNCLYLGGQDVETARYIAAKANKTVDSILNMPLGSAYLFTRGQKAKAVRKYDINDHEAYAELHRAGRAQESQP